MKRNVKSVSKNVLFNSIWFDGLNTTKTQSRLGFCLLVRDGRLTGNNASYKTLGIKSFIKCFYFH